MARPFAPQDPRPPEQIREQYDVERELADRLRAASREERKQLYTELYEELFRRIPHHQLAVVGRGQVRGALEGKPNLLAVETPRHQAWLVAVGAVVLQHEPIALEVNHRNVDGQIESLRRALELDPQDRGRVEGLVHALMISHHYDEAQSVLESTDIEEYYLSYLSSMLRVKEHRDFDLWAQDVARLVTEFEGTDDFYSYDLWETSIATRNFKAAEKFLSQMPGHADDPNPYHQYGTKLRNSIYTFFFLRKQEELAIAASQLRSIIDGGRDPNGDFDRARAALDLALIEAVEGNYDEALRLVRHWRRLASDDLAELLRGRSQACSIFGIVGASKEAVECLRNAFEEPSFALPFIDPFYPHYDSIRDQPEFVELLAEIDGEM
jgi:tetratricopeptide (TPR) repeat protein